ncbi:MAG: enoyl-CoA hydratase/isomerase family protein [Acidobacteriia bacterium]|nr:enoyl-CoA hydratase/isomerase family protein [Terriglobia bacterium]
MSYTTLLTETRDAISTVTVNRPERLNALNRQVMQELDECFRGLQTDDGVRVVILTGAGEKAFVAGADINELAALTPLEGQEFSRYGQGVLDRIENLGKPVIAAVNGFALGGGCELAMACTLRVASESARFAQPEVKLGIIPGYAGTQRLARLVGKGRALELILTGEAVTAQEAYRLGLVNQVVPPAELMNAARALARKILANAPLAIKFALEAVHHGLEMTQEEGQFLEATLFGLCCTTEDMKEGTRAFLEKRPAKFVGR